MNPIHYAGQKNHVLVPLDVDECKRLQVSEKSVDSYTDFLYTRSLSRIYVNSLSVYDSTLPLLDHKLDISFIGLYFTQDFELLMYKTLPVNYNNTTNKPR